MKKFLSFLLLAVCGTVFGQTSSVFKSTAVATQDQITADLKFGTGRTGTFMAGSTLTLSGSFGGTPTGGTLSLVNTTLTLPATVAGGATSLVRQDGSYADPAWITSLLATKLTGTIADARLSANVPLLNIANSFTGTLSTTGALSAAGHTTFEGVTSTGATGTGNLVYSITPTLTGSPVVGGVTFNSSAATALNSIASASSTAMTLTSDTALLYVGPLAAFNVLAGVTPFTELEVDSTVTTSPRGIMTAQFNTGTDGARLHFRKARGTRASPLTLVTGDNLGRLVGTGYDGSAYQEMASIIFGTEGTIASTQVPTNIQFWTATNAAPSVLTLAGKFDSSQLFTLTNSLTMAGTLTGAATLTGTNSITSAADLTLTGNAGASLVLGNGASGNVIITPASPNGALTINQPSNTRTTIINAGNTIAALQLTSNGKSWHFDHRGNVNANALYIGSTDFDPAIQIAETSGDTKLNSATASTSTTTGAFQVVGGAGIGGAAVIGGNITSTKNSPRVILQSTSGTSNNAELQFNDSTNAVIWDMGSDWAGTKDGEFYLASGGATRVMRWTSGTLSSGATINAYTTDSSSTSTGSLQTLGGLGVAKKAYVGTFLQVGDSTIGGFTFTPAQITFNTLSSQTNDIIAINGKGTGGVDFNHGNGSGGVRFLNGTSTVVASIDGSGNINTAATTASTSTTTGALVVSGGVGVAGAAWIGGLLNVAGASATFTCSNGITVTDGTLPVINLTKTGTSAGTAFISNDGVNLQIVSNSAASSGMFIRSDGTINFTNRATNTTYGTISSAGLSSASTTEATTGGVGSLTTAGGIYATKKIITATDLIVGKTSATTPSALTYASPTSVDVTLANVYTVTTVNATGSVTFNATAGGTAGQRVVFIITNDATSAKTITFGTNFSANGTLTPSGANKVATIEFISNGTTLYELCRTVLP